MSKDSEEKVYYYIKLEDNYFDIKIQKALRRLPSGADMLICYLKMQLKYAKKGGIIKFDGIYDDIFKEISIDIDEDEDIVKITINCLARWGVLELSDSEIYMSEMQHRIGTKTDVALRVAKHREKKKREKLLQCNNDVTKSNVILESEIELEDGKIDINNIYTQLQQLELVQFKTDIYNSNFKRFGIYLESISIPEGMLNQAKLYQLAISNFIVNSQFTILEKITIEVLEKVYAKVINAKNVQNVSNYYIVSLENELVGGVNNV